ncbi:N-acetylmuramoyl-L-alanine amidase-like domain-containing protein [Flagellimonas halotolerans]|uniref:N-acetylmuramoyl-L-alanine amidase-like domain-containing protein n=1 Tax=Flagellimonas halotolerans TaxID=3112164 RepID=A0ABU6ILQ5_9FLAO|nr:MULTISPECIES: N-acetylmuramoyl-L-alanine amidase-like domain-containing protein [unclassified Allomuricauda]MEC3964089.1 N-acetylmuramoyl-L-alanine amidase-like domain-containing protein [Muricauda sp. SYSU M86414]MEC4263959.1 N-acetylmuramoyl-L-alanine amidase-like domain-containing protein [Muricauda sp. SYSU M84420]
MRNRTLIALLILAIHAHAQQITCSPGDKSLFKTKINDLEQTKASNLGDTIALVGQSFLGTPYVEKTLEVGDTETLVVNFGGLDCTTFVENVLALSLMLQNQQKDFESFTQNLETVRYRNGKLDGYPSRLHYFTEWIRNNEKKGLVKDITAELDGVELEKPINFMGTHRNLYPFLASDENFEAMLAVEKEIAKEALCYLPQDQIESREHLIKSGDILALATSIKGLDVTHTGIAIHQPDGRLHLLHASSKNGEVEISDLPLADYLKNIKSNIGIIVARPTLLSL